MAAASGNEDPPVRFRFRTEPTVGQIDLHTCVMKTGHAPPEPGADEGRQEQTCVPVDLTCAPHAGLSRAESSRSGVDNPP